MKQIIFVFAILAVFVMAAQSAPPQETCGENETFVTCGSACPPTCGESKDFCTAQCVIGCQCKEGYLRKPNGGCVVQKDC